MSENLDVWVCLEWLREFLYNWQTLISAMIALGAAIWTIRTMRSASNDDKDRHQKLQQRKLMVARAQMPDALSDTSSYILELGSFFQGKIRDKPNPPSDAINTLKSVIEFIDNDAALRVFETVSHYQVHQARLRHFSQQSTAISKSQQYYDTILLNVYVDSLYGYARNTDENYHYNDPTKQEMFGRVNMVFTPSNHDDAQKRLLELIEIRHE